MSKRRDAMRSSLYREAKREAGRTPYSASFLFDAQAIMPSRKAGTLSLPYSKAMVSFPIDDVGTMGSPWTIQRAGQRLVSPKSPSWYQVVRTDTTDYVNRRKNAVKLSKEW